MPKKQYDIEKMKAFFKDAKPIEQTAEEQDFQKAIAAINKAMTEINKELE